MKPDVASCDRWHAAPTCADPACYRERHYQDQELSNEDVDRSSPDDLRAAYRSLRDHHLTETTALISRRDDLTRRRDDALAKSNQVHTKSQRLLIQAQAIMHRDEETIDRLGSENARLSEIVDFMQHRYSPIGNRPCALCVYDDDRLVRYCAMHRWHDTAAKILAARAVDPENPATTDYLSDEELVAWADAAFAYREPMAGSYLRLILDELRERRDAEAMFVDVDLQLQVLVDCEACADDTHGSDDEHRKILKRWRIAQGTLCALARIHRGYLRSRNAPDGEDHNTPDGEDPR